MNISSSVNIAAPTFSDLAKAASAQENAQARANPLPPVEPANESANVLNRDNPNQNLAPNQNGENAEAVEERDANGQGSAENETNSDTREGREQSEGNEENATGPTSPSGQALTEQELEQIKLLAARDTEVRTHERAHASVGGDLAGAPSYTYERGPNGQRYAVGGEVSIDVSPVAGDPEATIRKMEQVQRAALAPAEPSSQDRAVAASASQQAAQARAELTSQASQTNDSAEDSDESSSKPSVSASGSTIDRNDPSAVADKNRQRISQAQPSAISIGSLLQAQA